MKKVVLLGVVLSAVFFASTGALAANGSTSLYLRLGGEKSISALVDDFVANASSNPKVNFVRVGAPRNWEPTPQSLAGLKKSVVDFLSSAAGSQEHGAQGKDLKGAFAGMQITNAEFDAAVEDFKFSMMKFSVGTQEQKELLAIAEKTRTSVVEVADIKPKA